MPQSFTRNNPPRFLQIALDFARKIVDKQYRIGERVFARSVLATLYNVSSETARRAMSILEDHGVVLVEKNSGIKILSYENAVAFLNEYQSVRSLEDIQNEIVNDFQNLESLINTLKNKINTMVEKTDRFKDMGPFVPYQITIPSPSSLEGKTLMDIHFWQHTKATVIAIQHEDELRFSPGPHAILHAGDVLYFVGDRSCYERVQAFINEKDGK